VVTECTTMFIIHKLYVVLIQFASVFFMGLEQRVIIHRHNITWLALKLKLSVPIVRYWTSWMFQNNQINFFFKGFHSFLI